jgi:GWxTD domain-containing protein
MKINSSGIYFIELDTLHNEGCTVHGVDFDFPSVTSHEQMIACTRFILNNEEYERLTSAKDKQAAIEDFWISIGGNKERARQLIRRYYGRVKDANRYFSSFQDGWRTDRGMIFIVYGPPDKVYVSNNLETWTYGRDGTPQALVFRFNKRVNRFSENDFVLERSPQLKADWFMAVMNWREGRVISD